MPGLRGGDFVAVSGGGVGGGGLVRDWQPCKFSRTGALIRISHGDVIYTMNCSVLTAQRRWYRRSRLSADRVDGDGLADERLPDAFTLTGIGIGFVLTCVQAFFLAPGEGDIVLNTTHQLRLSSPGSFQAQGNVFLTGTEALVMGRVAAIAGAALILLVVRWTYKALRKRDGMGLGDVKLLAMIAAFLGFGEALLALFVGVMAASVYGLVLIARRRAGRNTKLPLGSFLAAGGLFTALLGKSDRELVCGASAVAPLRRAYVGPSALRFPGWH